MAAAVIRRAKGRTARARREPHPSSAQVLRRQKMLAAAALRPPRPSRRRLYPPAVRARVTAGRLEGAAAPLAAPAPARPRPLRRPRPSRRRWSPPAARPRAPGARLRRPAVRASADPMGSAAFARRVSPASTRPAHVDAAARAAAAATPLPSSRRQSRGVRRGGEGEEPPNFCGRAGEGAACPGAIAAGLHSGPPPRRGRGDAPDGRARRAPRRPCHAIRRPAAHAASSRRPRAAAHRSSTTAVAAAHWHRTVRIQAGATPTDSPLLRSMRPRSRAVQRRAALRHRGCCAAAAARFRAHVSVRLQARRC